MPWFLSTGTTFIKSTGYLLNFHVGYMIYHVVHCNRSKCFLALFVIILHARPGTSKQYYRTTRTSVHEMLFLLVTVIYGRYSN